MGWCSATEIMDAAVGAAEAVVKSIYARIEQDEGTAYEWSAREDEELRPFVAAIAAKLRDSDWDCIDESEYYDRFAQEMHGETDREYATRLVEALRDAHETDRPHWLERLNRHYEKMGRTDGAG